VTTNLIAVLASAGLLTAGMAASTETRSSAAIPFAMLSAKPAVKAPGISANRQGNRPDCSLASNASLPACSNPGNSGEALSGGGSGGGVSGAVLGVVAAGGIGTAVALAAKNDSNG
jgi:hypothetical protein